MPGPFLGPEKELEQSANARSMSNDPLSVRRPTGHLDGKGADNASRSKSSNFKRLQKVLYAYIQTAARGLYLTTTRFYLATAIAYVLILSVLFAYGAIYRLDDPVNSSSSAAASHALHHKSSLYADAEDASASQTPNLSMQSVANVTLVVATLLFAMLVLMGSSRPIKYEFAFIIVVAWIAFSAVARAGCLCCSPPTSSFAMSSAPHTIPTVHRNLGENAKQLGYSASPVRGDPDYENDDGAPTADAIPPTPEAHVHPDGKADTADYVQHLIQDTGLCANLDLIVILHNAGIVVLITMLYAAIFYDHDYFKLEAEARKRMLLSLSSSDIEAANGMSASLSGQPSVNSTIYAVKLVLLVLVLMLALIPLSCNNATIVTLDQYLLRVILFAVIFLLRLINSHAGIFYLTKFTRMINTISAGTDRGARVDERIPASMPNLPVESIVAYANNDSEAALEYASSATARKRKSMFDSNGTKIVGTTADDLVSRTMHSSTRMLDREAERLSLEASSAEIGAAPWSLDHKERKRGLDLRRMALERGEPDLVSSFSSVRKAEQIELSLRSSYFLGFVVDGLISLTPFVVCGWFLFATVPQIIYEFVLLGIISNRTATLLHEAAAIFYTRRMKHRGKTDAIQITSASGVPGGARREKPASPPLRVTQAKRTKLRRDASSDEEEEVSTDEDDFSSSDDEE